MKRQASMAVVAGLLSVIALGLAAQHAFAAITWGGQWGAWAPNGQASSCTGPWTGANPGTGAVNGNDPGQDLAWCYANGAWTCGTQGSSFQFYVHTAGYNVSLNQYEYTGASLGPSIGSTAGGFRIDQTTCQMGYGPR
jgi:hypothetical protein